MHAAPPTGVKARPTPASTPCSVEVHCFRRSAKACSKSARRLVRAAAQSTAEYEPVVIEPPQTVTLAPASSRSLQNVSELASAWGLVSRRLPSSAPDSNQHFEILITALKVALVHLQTAPVRRDGRTPAARAVQLAVTLADLCAAGLPLDADAIAAGVVLEAVDLGYLDYGIIIARLGPDIAALVHDVMRVRTAPQRIELYDDVASSAIREWCLAFHDVRANAVEVISRWDELQNMASLPTYEQQLLALESLQVYAPLGHALGLGPVCAMMEDLCFKVLFPESYNHTSVWLRRIIDTAEDELYACQQQLLAALDDHPTFKDMAASCVLRARTKSLFSIMKKLLRLGNIRQGGRQREQIYDLLGMRAIIQPRQDVPPDQAEALAVQACYIVQEVAQTLWTPLHERTKDYVATPKPNGYQSIHITLTLNSSPYASSSDDESPFYNHSSQQQQHATHGIVTSTASSCIMSSEGRTGSRNTSSSSSSSSRRTALAVPDAVSRPYLELQIRTQLMDELAESGEAAHAAYKGGLDSRQARQLQTWTRELQLRLELRSQRKLLLPPLLPPLSATSMLFDASWLSSAVYLSDAVPGAAVGVSAANQLFRHMDANGDGRISVEELQQQLQELDGSGGEPDAAALVALLQVEGEEDAGLDGLTPEGFARFLKKASMVQALSKLDKQTAEDLFQPQDSSKVQKQ